MNEKVTHNYGIDLLRIVAMLMIIAHHFSLHSGVEFNTVNVNSVFVSVMALGGKTGVNIFVLITGYYSTGKIKGKKIINLFGNASLYSIVLTVVAVLCGYLVLNEKMLIKTCLPLLFGNGYWFIVAYLELYILTPLLNKIVRFLDKKSYETYLICFACLLCVLPSMVGRFIQVNDFGYSTLIWFVYMYFFGAYLKKFEVTKKFGGAKHACLISQLA